MPGQVLNPSAKGSRIGGRAQQAIARIHASTSDDQVDAVWETVIRKAVAGDKDFCKLFLAYMCGKPIQPIVTGQANTVGEEQSLLLTLFKNNPQLRLAFNEAQRLYYQQQQQGTPAATPSGSTDPSNIAERSDSRNAPAHSPTDPDK